MRHRLVSFLFIVFFPLSVQAGQVAVAASEWYPYISKDLGGNGFACEVVTYAFLAAGYETEYIFTSWEDGKKKVRRGQAAAVIGYESEAKSAPRFYLSDPIATSKGVFFYRKDRHDRIDFSRIDDLKSYTIGGVRGRHYVSDFLEAGLKLNFSSDPSISFKKLYIGVVDLVPENSFVGWSIIDRLYPNETFKFAETPKAIATHPVYLMMADRPRSKKLMDQFNAGLKIIREKGIYSSLLRKYIKEVEINTPQDIY